MKFDDERKNKNMKIESCRSCLHLVAGKFMDDSVFRVLFQHNCVERMIVLENNILNEP